MKKLIIVLLGVALILAFASSSARAVDLSGKFGAGFSGDLINALSLSEDNTNPGALSDIAELAMVLPDMSFLSVKYHINPKISASLQLGYDSKSSGKIKPNEGDEFGEKHKIGIFGIGAKGFYNLIERDKINFYAHLGLIYQTGSHKWTEEVPMPPDPPIDFDYKVSLSGLEIVPGAGAEYFPVENLGISLEFGFKYMSLTVKAEQTPEGGDTTSIEQKFSGFSTTGSIFDVGIHYYFF